jgi:xylulokinase
MMADVVKLPIHILEQGETGCLGAALYAGVGVGVYKDCEEAAQVAKIKKTFDPNPANNKAYDEAYDKFNNIYDAMLDKIF